jgi:hypothetical protein
VQAAVLKNALYRVGQEALGANLWNQGAVSLNRLGTAALDVPY